jgi:hypothetical protein
MGLEIINKRNEEDAYLFKRSIRKLLDATFIVADKDEKLYDFIAAESNHYDVNTYLSLIGYQVMVDDRLKVAMLQQHDEDVETVGLKRANLYRFDSKQIRLLLVLWMLYLERMGYKEPVFVTVGDIIDKCGIYQISLTPADFKGAYLVFRRFNLIDFGDDIGREDGIVRLYPSLQFCMDIGQLKRVIEEYTGMPDISAESGAEDSADLFIESEEEEYE